VTPTKFWGFLRLRVRRRLRAPIVSSPRNCTPTPTSTIRKRRRVSLSLTPPMKSPAMRTSARPSTAARSMPKASPVFRGLKVLAHDRVLGGDRVPRILKILALALTGFSDQQELRVLPVVALKIFYAICLPVPVLVAGILKQTILGLPLLGKTFMPL